MQIHSIRWPVIALAMMLGTSCQVVSSPSAGCEECDGGRVVDGGVVDGGAVDSGVVDSGVVDGGVVDGGVADGGVADGGVADGGVADGGIVDGGVVDGGPGEPCPIEALPDSDEDGISDQCDIDDDNDGILDVVETIHWQEYLQDSASRLHRYNIVDQQHHAVYGVKTFSDGGAAGETLDSIVSQKRLVGVLATRIMVHDPVNGTIDRYRHDGTLAAAGNVTDLLTGDEGSIPEDSISAAASDGRIISTTTALLTVISPSDTMVQYDLRTGAKIQEYPWSMFSGDGAWAAMDLMTAQEMGVIKGLFLNAYIVCIAPTGFLEVYALGTGEHGGETDYSSLVKGPHGGQSFTTFIGTENFFHVNEQGFFAIGGNTPVDDDGFNPHLDGDSDGNDILDLEEADANNFAPPSTVNESGLGTNFPEGGRVPSDSDGDGVADYLDYDNDGDSILDSRDNCREISNIEQFDEDNDGVGDACDNCPGIANTDQANFLDNDDVGDACDPRPNSDGDEIIFFEPFRGGQLDATHWEFIHVGGDHDYSLGGGSLRINADSRTYLQYIGPMLGYERYHRIEAKGDAASIFDFGVFVGGETGGFCALRRGQWGNFDSDARRIQAWNITSFPYGNQYLDADNFASFMPKVNDGRVKGTIWNDENMSCSLDQGGPLIGEVLVTADAPPFNGELPNDLEGNPGLYVRSEPDAAEVVYEYAVIYGLGGDPE